MAGILNRKIGHALQLACLMSAAMSLASTAHAKMMAATATPIEHVVVIFQENVSFDKYFGTYPHAANLPGEPPFYALPGTPKVNGFTEALLRHNPNKANPFRIDHAHAAICSQDHEYTAEQRAYDHGRVDKFVETAEKHDKSCDPKTVMGYYDGNTVTALWNYAQHFAMSDYFFNTTYGPSSPGAINLVSGQTHGATSNLPPAKAAKEIAGDSLIGDVDPQYDDCSKPGRVAMSGRNVGDLLNAKGITWGWFEGGFRPTSRKPDGAAVCGLEHTGSNGKQAKDYSPHHEPFQYYVSTANPHHLPPSSVAMIGRTDQANHQYDLTDFWAALRTHHLPAVSYLKAPTYQDGHAGYSDPLNEQQFLVQTISRLMRSPEWKHTAILLTYDDSDGAYDHVQPPLINGSDTPADALDGTGQCGHQIAGAYGGRCGHGPRLPLLVISPYAKTNFVDHTQTDQTSLLRFIEDNWHLGRIGDQSYDARAGSLAHLFNFSSKRHAPPLYLDPQSGEIMKTSHTRMH